MALFAKHSDDFLIGNYSYWRTYGAYAAAADSAFKHMKDCGYNTTICNTYNNEDIDLGVMLNKMDSDSLDAILTDFSWDAMQSNTKYGTRGFTLSNLQRFEAEYCNEEDVKDNDHQDDVFFYSSRDIDEGDTLRVGQKQVLEGKSNDFVWKCEPSSQPAGYAFNNLSYRWKKEGSSVYEKLTDEIQFIKMTWDQDLTDYMLDNTYLYYTVAFNILSYDRDIAHPIDLIRLELCGYNWNNEFKQLRYVNELGGTDVGLVVTQYMYDGITRTDDFGNKLYTFRISLRSLKDNGFLSADNALSGRYALGNINPRIYWYGTSTLHIDYIEIEDTIHRNMITNQQQFTDNLNSRINEIKLLSAGNIRFLYSFDEPNQAQFDSYKRVQNAIRGDNPGIVTAIYDWRRDMVKSNNAQSTLDKYYHHQRAFIEKANPKILSPDLYPIKPDVQWNFKSDLKFLQTALEDNLLVKYHAYKTASQQNPNLRFIPVVQSFGAWDRSGTTHQWMSWLRPPRETQKMLQLLPLCYGVDGVINYQFPTWNKLSYSSSDTLSYQYGAISIIQQGTNLSYVPLSNYYALKEANDKIIRYATVIKNSDWHGSDSLKVSIDNQNIAISPMMLQSLFVLPSENGHHYQGYVQCGLYTYVSQPYFMIVNRRANYVRFGYNPVFTENSSLDNCFEAALPQTVRFVPNTQAHTMYGSNLAMYDPYTDMIHTSSGQNVDVVIDPGDGMLLKMIGTLPELVNAPATLAKDVVLEGDILLANGVNVTVSPHTTLRVKANAHITISSGASFIFRGSVTFEDGSTITVLPNGSVNFDAANCVWGNLAKVDVVNGSISVEGGHWDKSADAIVWGGISANSSSTVTITGATIKNANVLSIHNSNLIITDSKFEIPASKYGLLISNTGEGYATRIENSQPGMGFFGASNQNSKGIVLGRVDNHVVLDNVNFQNLLFGVFKNTNSSYGDSLVYCNFTNCLEGLKLTSSEYNANIDYCSFNQNVIGIRLTAANPKIIGCNFTSCTKGILSELTVLSTGVDSGIFESNFYNGGIGIESRNSNHRVKNNYFNRNQSGIINHAGSNLNLSYGANNVLMNHENNIMFFDSQAYESTIQLFRGHNDFYHLYDDQTNILANDFSFDNNYFNYPIGRFIKIDASKNWYQDQEVRINDPIYVDYVYVDLYDPNPNMPPPPPENDRLSIALSLEVQGLYDQAMEIFKAVLDEQLDTEKRFFSCAADGIYRLSNLVTDPSWITTDYFETKAIQYEINEPQMSSLLKEYLAKAYLVEKDYQRAIDLIQLRIDNPVSEVDSLLAVLDLEIVLLLADMNDQKKPITTMYVQYKYPDHQVFSVKHDEHWAMLYDLLDKGEISEIYIPKYANITTNYPNPFNPTTTIEFSVPETSQVKLVIYNLRGQKVRDIVNTEMLKGHHKVVWDGKDNNDRSVSSGIFFACLESSRNRSVRKLMLMK